MMSSAPRVTVGLPVYNGAATLESAVRPLLAQTFSDFELLISDNASTDATPEITARLAREDARVRVVRQAVNLGANGNYSFVAENARGSLLKWASASDWIAPSFLERCVKALDANPDAVLAAPRTRLFEGNPEGAVGVNYDGDFDLLAATPLARLEQFFASERLNNAFNGLIRLSALRQTRLVEPYLCADIVLMGHLALLGKFVLVDEVLYYRRMEVGTSTTLQDPASRMRHHYPVLDARTLFQEWKQQLGWLRAGLSAPMESAERARVVGYLLRRMVWCRDGLMRDLRDAARYTLGRRAPLHGT
jgi:glycosyltransferase involved in cell wall biosynthesis